MEALADPDCGWFYRANADSFKQIPGSPIAYWISEAMLSAFAKGKPLGELGRTSKGLITGDNDYSLRLWWENCHSDFSTIADSIDAAMSSGCHWFPCNTGGIYRKWYGNHDYTIRWVGDGENVFLHAKDTGHHSQDYDSALKFRPNVSWSDITSGAPSFRLRDNELSDHKGMPYYPKDISLEFATAMLNSSVAAAMLSFLSPTLSLNIGELEKIPLLSPVSDTELVESKAAICAELARADWDSFETSWDFSHHPLV